MQVSGSVVSTDRSTRRKRPTQADVARQAGVSQAMVSYVLNDKAEEVSAETRDRVLAVIEEIGYVPDGAARSLRTRKTQTIACIIPDITNPFYPALERGIQRCAEAEGYDLIVSNTDGVVGKESRALRGLRGGRADGAVMVPFHVDRERVHEVTRAGIALTMLYPPDVALLELGVDMIEVDTGEGARMAVDYLIAQGHQRIGMIAGIANTPPREYRLAGYRQALQSHGLPADELLIRGADYQEEGGYEAMVELLRLEDRPTAVFAANDLMALGAMMAIRAAGLRIPDDIAIIGLDDIPAAKLVHPPLTTVAQFPDRLGQLAAELLFSRLRGEAPERGRLLRHACELIVRDSA